MFQVASSQAMSFAESGGICKVIVRGTQHVARQWEAGWSNRTNEYIQADWIALETPESLAEELSTFAKSLNDDADLGEEDLVSEEDDVMDEDRENDNSSFIVSDDVTDEDEEFLEGGSKGTATTSKKKKSGGSQKSKSTKTKSKKRSSEELDKESQANNSNESHSDGSFPNAKRLKSHSPPTERASI